MCGLVGMVAKRRSGFFGFYDDYFKNILVVDSIRGEDSTGVFSVDTDGDVHVLKEATTPSYFFFDPEYRKWQDQITKTHLVTIGHNRKATQGKIVDDNAHPFVVKGELVLVHNGTLTHHTGLKETADVDSEVLAKYIHRETPEDVYDGAAWGKVFDKVYGAYALIWYDLRINKLFVLRNSQRPLVMGETEDAFLFASEGPMIHLAASRNKIKVDNYKEVPVKTLFVFDLDSEEIIMKPKEVAVVAHPFQQASTHSTYIMGKGTTSETDPLTVGGKRFKKATEKFVGTIIKVKVENVVEQVEGSCEYYFYGSSKEVSYLHDVVGAIEGSEAVGIVCTALHVNDDDFLISCKVESVQKVGNKLQLNVKFIGLSNEATLTH